MTGLLVRLFVKDHEKTENPAVRGRYGTLAGVVGIACNSLLFAGKLSIGLLSGSVSIMADAVNNLTDAASSVMTLFGFRMAQKPADAEHPYGHARYEYLSGLGVAALILLIGAQLGETSFRKILHPTEVKFSLALALVLVLSILGKLWLALFNRNIGRRIDSTALAATAADSRNDMISTAAVLVSALIAWRTGWQLDGYIGLAVALFIIYSGVGIARETIRPLLGSAAPAELVQRITAETLQFSPLILGIHDLMVHEYGPGRCFATLHAEIDCREDVLAAHETIDDLERMFHEKYEIHLVIHYDPIVTDDAELNSLRHAVLRELKIIDTHLAAHDFRMVRGTEHSTLIFDVVLPFSMTAREEEIRARLAAHIAAINPAYTIVVTFDPQEFNRA
jgi:cation diffusion facilitator family transporter